MINRLLIASCLAALMSGCSGGSSSPTDNIGSTDTTKPPNDSPAKPPVIAQCKETKDTALIKSRHDTYQSNCASCHAKGHPASTMSMSLEQMTKLINDTMPLGNTMSCTSGCAQDMALVVLGKNICPSDTQPTPSEPTTPTKPTAATTDPNKPVPGMTALNSASRFLTQATLGANYKTIEQVAQMGEGHWLENQFNQPVGFTLPYALELKKQFDQYDNEDLGGAALGDPALFKKYSWWGQIMTSSDLLRQRMATALGEIFVISDRISELWDHTEPMAHYHDMLLQNSFGNFQDLLMGVTLHPSMGIYLSHLNNAKADPTKGTYPDENYAREIMQLFSIGLFELNQDGTRKKDQHGKDIPTYNNETIREYARVFTGLSHGRLFDKEVNEELPPFFGAVETDAPDYTVPMKMFQAFHDTDEKKLLNGLVLPAGQSGMEDVKAAVEGLFNHPNVGPFIGRLLIQRLVKSNPSPQYIANVATAFNDNGLGVRGDMKAVIRAILFDDEARTAPANASIKDGRLREPFLRYIRFLRAMSAKTENSRFHVIAEGLYKQVNQRIFSSPSVFNFFLPDYAPNGIVKQHNLVAPEFEITTASTIIAMLNAVFGVTLDETMMENIGSLSKPIELDLSAEFALAKDTGALLNRLDTVLTYGSLTHGTKEIIANAVNQVKSEQEKVYMALYLILISPDFAITI